MKGAAQVILRRDLEGNVIAPVSPEAAQTWSLLADRIAAEPSPRVKANLAMVARHVEEEVRGDVPALMATLARQPTYSFWGATDSAGPEGYEAVKAHYESLVAIGKNRLEFELTRTVADDETVVTEGFFRHAYTGQMLMDRASANTLTLDPTSWYLVEYKAIVVWRMTPDGLIDGEDIYAGEVPRVLGRLAPGERPHLGPVDRDSSPGGSSGPP